MTPRLVWGMNSIAQWSLWGSKTPAKLLLKSISSAWLLVFFSQMTHPNSGNSIGPSSIVRVHDQASNFGFSEKVFLNFWKSALDISWIYLVHQDPTLSVKHYIVCSFPDGSIVLYLTTTGLMKKLQNSFSCWQPFHER